MDKNVPEQLSAMDTALMDSHDQHQVLEEDHTYSTVDETEEQVFVVSSNPAYNTGSKSSQLHPVQNDDAHSDTKLSQEQEMLRSGLQAHGDALGEAASAK